MQVWVQDIEALNLQIAKNKTYISIYILSTV